MRTLIAGDKHPSVRQKSKRLAVPVAGDPAGAFDDRQHWAEIVRIEARLDDHVDKAERDEPISVAIGAVAHELGCAGYAREGVGVALAEHVGAGREHRRRADIRAGAAAYRAAVMRRLIALGADPALARDRLIDDPE